VVAWLRSRDGRELCTTSITVAEIRYGIERLPAGRRRQRLGSAAQELFASFAEQVLPFDLAAAEEYTAVAFAREQAGAPIAGLDAQIAAICRAHRAPLATRNVKDFEGTGIDTVDPWGLP
jgi:predicted nucleic acid-binding protein